MNKQEIAHILEKEITTTNRTLRRLQRLYSQTIDSHQARDIDDMIQDLVSHKKNLENIIEKINEDARNYIQPKRSCS